MRAVACEAGKLEVVDVPDPRPAEGQVVLQVSRCGICGSDLHARQHCDELAEVMVESGYDGFMRSDQRVVFGHEFSGEIAEYGPRCRRRHPTGSPVVALPMRRGDGGVHPTGLSAAAPGAYAEQVVVEESLLLPVPNGLAPAVAALTEPMAIGLHAVRRGQVSKRRLAIVLGCGPIGLAVISVLKAQGVRSVVASDPSPGRRALAAACGADFVVDPLDQSPYAAIEPRGTLRTMPDGAELLVGTMEKLGRLPIPWHPVMRAAERLGLGPEGPAIFECVGVPGMIDGIIAGAPFYPRVVVVGVCMGQDRLRPAMAIGKEVDLRFVLGYTPLEFRETLHLLADGTLDVSPIVTGTVGLDGVAAAFDILGEADSQAKILIDPAS
ncbi:MAG: zinc-binding dehydrogenase, partial [Acidimicrobiales bacterium]